VDDIDFSNLRVRVRELERVIQKQLHYIRDLEELVTTSSRKPAAPASVPTAQETSTSRDLTLLDFLNPRNWQRKRRTRR
jgi:hypothetical protein